MEITPHAAAMYSADAGSSTLGIELLEASSQHAITRLTITDGMVNGLDVCHGGYVFALADTALAFAANASGEGALTYAATIHYRRPARSGDVLTATAVVEGHEERNVHTDVEVVNQRGETVAALRGESRLPG